MKTVKILKNWKKCDKAQLKNFISLNKNEEISINNIIYKVDSGFMDENDVPKIALIRKKTGDLQYVPLALIDENYTNYSALGDEGKKELMKKLNLIK